MDIDKFKKLFTAVYPYLSTVGLTGLGETVLYPHLRECVEFIKAKKSAISIYLSTNASVPSCVEVMDSVMNTLGTIQISIDGVGSVFEQVRRGATYDAFLRNATHIAQHAKRKGVGVVLNMVIIKENYHQMVDIIKLAKTMDVPGVTVTPINLAGVDWDLSYYDFFRSSEFTSVLEQARRAAVREGISFSYVTDVPHKGIRNCRYVWNHSYITWDGFLVPCCAKPFPKELNFGNVFEKGLFRCLNSRRAVAFRIAALSNTIPEFCSRCHWINK
jgi:radical SAM protein with 4Fe4S-binding SPASM domain